MNAPLNGSFRRSLRASTNKSLPLRVRRQKSAPRRSFTPPLPPSNPDLISLHPPPFISIPTSALPCAARCTGLQRLVNRALDPSLAAGDELLADGQSPFLSFRNASLRCRGYIWRRTVLGGDLRSGEFVSGLEWDREESLRCVKTEKGKEMQAGSRVRLLLFASKLRAYHWSSLNISSLFLQCTIRCPSQGESARSFSSSSRNVHSPHVLVPFRSSTISLKGS